MKCENANLKIGMISIGMAEYWPQMPGMKEELLGYGAEIARRLGQYGDVFYPGIVDSVTSGRSVRDQLKAQAVDILFVHCGTYAPSKSLLATVHGLDIPIITLHLQPVKDFTKASHSEYTMPKNTFSCSGEVGNVLIRAGKIFDCVVGQLTDERAWNMIAQWAKAAAVKKELACGNIAWMGNYLPGMCDLYADMTRMIYTFGVNIEIVELADLARRVQEVPQEETKAYLRRTQETYAFIGSIADEQLNWCAQVAAGMKRFADDYGLSAMAFHANGRAGSFEEKVGYSMTLGGSFLSSEGVPSLAEGDILLTIPAIIMKRLTGAASQSEISLADYHEGFHYVGHSGPGDLSIAQDGPYLRWLPFFHGKRGSGVSCEFSVRHGPVTLVSLVDLGHGGYKLVVAEGEAIAGERLKNGNVSSRVRFGERVAEFSERWIKEGPSHHSIMGPGHQADALEKLAILYGIQMVRI